MRPPLSFRALFFNHETHILFGHDTHTPLAITTDTTSLLESLRRISLPIFLPAFLINARLSPCFEIHKITKSKKKNMQNPELAKKTTTIVMSDGIEGTAMNPQCVKRVRNVYGSMRRCCIRVDSLRTMECVYEYLLAFFSILTCVSPVRFVLQWRLE